MTCFLINWIYQKSTIFKLCRILKQGRRAQGNKIKYNLFGKALQDSADKSKEIAQGDAQERV